MGIFGKIIYSVYTDKPNVERLQDRIRAAEWKAISDFIPDDSKFLDVGCGAGYAMQRALLEKNCSVVGIDPQPGAHGVGRYENERIREKLEIHQGYSEQLPFKDASFDVVYSSHVLEHVTDESQTLQEMKRVLKPDGVLIIGIPTATMAWLNLFSQLVFTTHIKVYENIRFILQPGRRKRLVSIFRITSHSAPRAISIWYDIWHYRCRNWRKIVGNEFKIVNELYPLLYPYPDFRQLFKHRSLKNVGSSIFFISKIIK